MLPQSPVEQEQQRQEVPALYAASAARQSVEDVATVVAHLVVPGVLALGHAPFVETVVMRLVEAACSAACLVQKSAVVVVSYDASVVATASVSGYAAVEVSVACQAAASTADVVVAAAGGQGMLRPDLVVTPGSALEGAVAVLETGFAFLPLAAVRQGSAAAGMGLHDFAA